MRTPHEILGVAGNASADTVRSAYIRLAKMLHPDTAGGGDAAKFLEVKAAYDELRFKGFFRPGGNGHAATVKNWVLNVCGECNGTGSVTLRRAGFLSVTGQCKKCRGLGKVKLRL